MTSSFGYRTPLLVTLNLMYKKMKIRITATVHRPAKATPAYAKIHQILIRGPIKYRQAAFIKGSGLDTIFSHFTSDRFSAN